MSLQLVLMIGADEGFMTPIRDTIIEESIVGCEALVGLTNALPRVENVLPDLVLIFADSLEAAGENVNQFCLDLRESLLEYRPVIVIQTATTDETRRIEYLRDGADDIMSMQISMEEFRIRLLVHLRRTLDILSNRITRIPGLMLSAKFLQRKINMETPWVFMVVEIDTFQEYIEVYGHIPGEQVLRTFAAIMGAIVVPPDFIGHTDYNAFTIVTHPDKVEKIAAALCHQFEAVTPNFYADSDKERGYLISVVDERISRRVGFLSLSIGIVSSQTHPYMSHKEVFTSALVMKSLAKMKPGNSWVSERLQLTGSQTFRPPDKESILLIESDAALAFLLKTTLEMETYEVDAVSSPAEAKELLETKSYKLILMDSLLNGEAVGWALCEEIRAAYPEILIICISTLHDREHALRSGANLYMPKPFELVPLFTWIHRLTREK